MSSVYEENVECPVCHQRSAGLDLNCKTNEQELICHRPECGYAYEQQIVQRKSSSGKEYSFWRVTEEFPMNVDGSVRRRTNAVTEELKDVEILDPSDDGSSGYVFTNDEFAVYPKGVISCNHYDDTVCDFCENSYDEESMSEVDRRQTQRDLEEEGNL
jgi:hypothetical protein